MIKRPSVKDGRCAKCGSDNLMSWANDHVVICDDCGCNHAWPRTGQFYRGGGQRQAFPDGYDEPRDGGIYTGPIYRGSRADRTAS